MSEENNEIFGFFSEVRGLFNNEKSFSLLRENIRAFLLNLYSGFELIPDSGFSVSENAFFDLIRGYRVEQKISEEEKNGLKVYEKEYWFYAGCRHISGAVCDYVIKKLHIKYYVEKQNSEKTYSIVYIAGFTTIESPLIHKVIGKSKSLVH